MTVQTKRFLEISDILALQFTCKDCKASVVSPRNKIAKIPQNCPNCGIPWKGFESGDKDALEDFVNVLGRVAAVLPRRGFELTLEVSDAMPSTSQTSADQR